MTKGPPRARRAERLHRRDDPEGWSEKREQNHTPMKTNTNLKALWIAGVLTTREYYLLRRQAKRK